ncbi:MAG: glycosyltransferase family 4 protein [Pirellulales bacterium]|nr:glycosyltransferase family 4 protein [Pirellulales bacterium]
MDLIPLLLVLTLAAISSWLLVRGVTRLARQRRFFDVPNHRSQHTRPTPTGGGLAIVLVCAVGVAWVGVTSAEVSHLALGVYGLAALIVAGVSGLDDLRPLSYKIRLAVHVLVAVVLIAGCAGLDVFSSTWLGMSDFGGLGWVVPLVALFWIVGLTNAYNFMDGLDGMAGAQGVVAGTGWILLGWISGQTSIGLIGGLLAAASLGFLIENWPPARIFMGDVGSAFLGFSFAALPVIAAQADPRLLLSGVLLVWPFVFDTGQTFLRRLTHGENVFEAHRTHLYQRLVRAGVSPTRVTLLYAGLSLAGVLLAAVYVAVESTMTGWWIVGLTGVMAVGLWILVERRTAPLPVPTCVEPFDAYAGFVCRVTEEPIPTFSHSVTARPDSAER